MADPTTAAPEIEEDAPETPQADPVLVEEELLVEDVSIDGMCGVY
jgi:mycofactocin precursor